jgi:hypothetical protein
MFAPLDPPPLEALARSLEPVELAAGETLIRQGDSGDRYYVVADGVLDVEIDGTHVREALARARREARLRRAAHVRRRPVHAGSGAARRRRRRDRRGADRRPRVRPSGDSVRAARDPRRELSTRPAATPRSSERLRRCSRRARSRSSSAETTRSPSPTSGRAPPSTPNTSVPVSACVSKWTRPTGPEQALAIVVDGSAFLTVDVDVLDPAITALVAERIVREILTGIAVRRQA